MSKKRANIPLFIQGELRKTIALEEDVRGYMPSIQFSHQNGQYGAFVTFHHKEYRSLPAVYEYREDRTKGAYFWRRSSDWLD